MFRCSRLQGMFLSYSHVNNSPLIVRVNQLVSSLPLPVCSVLLCSLPVYPGDEAGDGDPEYQGDHYHGPHHVVFEKLEEAAHADLVNKVPDPDNVLAGFLTEPLVAEPLKAGSPVWQNVHGSHSVAGTVEVPPAASLAGVCTAVTHAGLFSLRLTEWNAFPSPALPLLYTVSAVSHVLRLGTLRTHPGALRLLLAGGVVGSPALGVHRHVLTVVAAGGVLVAADGVLSQLTVLVTADVPVL